MPTFRNDGERPVMFTDGSDLIIVDPGKNVQFTHWIPYKQKGLTLVSESYPPVPNPVLVCGEFHFTKGMKRRFEIEPCEEYLLNINPLKGAVTLYHGASKHGSLLTDEKMYGDTLAWKYAPYLIMICSSDEAVVEIQASRRE